MNTYTPNITDSQMLKFVHHLATKPEPFFSGSEWAATDTMAYMQYLEKHLKESWYGLSFAQMREDSKFQSDAMYKFVKSRQDRWLHVTMLAGELNAAYKYESMISGTFMGVAYIGDYSPFPEQIHEALKPVIWNDHKPPQKL